MLRFTHLLVSLFLASFTLTLAMPSIAETATKPWQKKTWDEKTLKERLTPLQWKVTREDDTEPPFDNAYWDNKKDGIYVDIVSGEPLFSSTDKFKSGTGWPSFTKPINKDLIIEKTDYKLIYPRSEVRSKYGDSHLGHVFSDGPEPTGLRYCINSAALRFITVSDLEKEGYGEYLKLFASNTKYPPKSNAPKPTAKIERATFAGGCFWCMEPPFDKLDGVISTTSGYAGGSVKNPTYKQVSAGTTGHTEVVQIEYDANRVSYEKLLDVFWRNIDPTVENRQFCDKGSQYRTEIFFHNEEQMRLAQASKEKLLKDKKFSKIYTQVTKLDDFYPAEDYHQDYYKKNPIRYKYYRYSCGRDDRLEELWGKK